MNGGCYLPHSGRNALEHVYKELMCSNLLIPKRSTNVGGKVITFVLEF